MPRLAVPAAVLAALTLAGPAVAGTGPTTSRPTPLASPLVAGKGEPRLDERDATAILLAHPQVRDWLARYPPRPRTDAEYRRERRDWEVKVWSGEAGQVALGTVDDRTGRVEEAWTGPQVAWKMARGYDGAFGGREVNRLLVWLLFCGAFLLGLADVRRPLSLRNLDLLVLLSFSISLWWFNRGEVFWSVPLAYPPLVYLAARLAWIGLRGRRPRTVRPVWPVWALVAATVFLAGFRIGLNVESSNVIDVGYSGVVGAHRIGSGEAPWGNFPVERGRRACGERNADGEVRDRVQTNGRCETANERGDTYGPVAYLAYVPGYWAFGWSGTWDGATGARNLPAAHATSLAFDLLCLAALALAGLRFGGARLAATLAFAWAAYPFTLYALSSNTNDALVPAFLLLAFLALARPAARGALVALAAWTKFAPLLVVPLWLTRERPLRAPSLRFAAGFLAATAASFGVLLLEPDPLAAARTFAERTVLWQVGRESPFSIWDWGQYRAAGIPDLGLVQRALQVVVLAAALAAAFVPRRLSPLRLAALTGALLVGFEVVLTHWSYLYIPWFFPFAAIALLAAAPPASAEQGEVDGARGRDTRPLVAAS